MVDKYPRPNSDAAMRQRRLAALIESIFEAELHGHLS